MLIRRTGAVARRVIVGVPLLLTSLAVTEAATTVAAHAAGTTELVSVSVGGGVGNGGSGDSIGIGLSADGRRVVFSSTSTDLVAGDTNGQVDVFVRDRTAGTTTRISLASDGSEATGPSFAPSISADGRYVAFTSLSPLVPDDTNGAADVYVREVDTAAVTRLSVTAAGDQLTSIDGASSADISGDGRYVLFSSSDPALAGPGGRNGVFVVDRDGDADGIYDETGATDLVRIDVGVAGAVNDQGGPFNSGTFAGSISPNGRFVFFGSYATNLVTGLTLACSFTQSDPFDPFGVPVVSPTSCAHAYVRDRDPDVDGVFDEADALTVLASATAAGVPADGDSGGGSVSDAGDATFWTRAPNLGGGGVPDTAIVVRDHTGTVEVVGLSVSNLPAISADGRYVAYDSFRANDVPNDTGFIDVYRFDRATGTTRRVSQAPDGTQFTSSGNPAVDAGGRVAFSGLGPQAQASTTAFNVYVHDAGGGDLVAPTITVTAPADGGSYSLGQTVAIGYSCSDPAPVVTCDGPVPPGATLDTSTAGVHTFTVSSADAEGNGRHVTATYDVLAGNVSTTVAPGDVVTTDPGGVGASPAVPVQTSVAVPAGVSGTVSVTPQPLGPSPSGFELLGTDLVLTGPPATAAAPYRLTFTIDASTLGPATPADLTVFRNGVAVAACVDPLVAAPDPCVVSRSTATDGSGDAVIVVNTSAFSSWVVGRSTLGVTALAPAALLQGANHAAVTVTGTGFRTGIAGTVSGTGVTVHGATVVSATEVVLDVSVAATAPPGPRDVTLTNVDGVSATCVGCFAVNGRPTITSVSPNVRGQGSTSTVTIRGQQFRPGATVAIGGNGLTVTNPVVVDATTLTVTVAVSPQADTTARPVTVRNVDATSVTIARAFTVRARPRIGGFRPSGQPVGTTRSVRITGTGFQPGATVTVSGGGGVTAVVTNVTPTAVTATITVPLSAARGNRSITVTNPDAGTDTRTGYRLT